MEPLLYTVFRYLWEGQNWQIEEVKKILATQGNVIKFELDDQRKRWNIETPAMEMLRKLQAQIERDLTAEAEQYLTSLND